MSNTGRSRWRHLVAPADLAALAAGDVRLFEVGFGALPAFLAGHIPGAAYLDTAQLESAPLWNKVDDSVLLALLLRCGVCHDSIVILYGRNNLAAARAAHLMLYAGVADVRLLDGGFHGWVALGLPGEAGPGASYPPAATFGTAVPAHPGYLLDMAAVRRLRRDDPGVLVSVRTWPEYQGHTSGYPYIAARGDIPGARWGRILNDDDINGMSEFHRGDGRMAHQDAIRRIWMDAGIHPGRRAVFYCGTGWRASLAFFYAWLMGWEEIGVYDGGWCEWSRDPANPVVCRAGVAD
ncbi:sulfurtransferase [Massilia sp. S19_KUP03_FR1]|uniref:sulfurtransferase n=1 Tax=Massilia sp. S19_KUP03_FR1 TaxID=3025503 RepID=UPI002FCD9308